jgi:hypothetical protein
LFESIVLEPRAKSLTVQAELEAGMSDAIPVFILTMALLLRLERVGGAFTLGYAWQLA